MDYKKKTYSQIESEVLRMLEQGLPEVCTYHSVLHTRDVIAESARIAFAENLGPEETQLLLLSALFHDTGFLVSPVEHEKTGCGIASEYLLKNGYSQREVAEISKAIMATKIPQSPENKIGEILCDADLDYLGRDDFFRIGQLLFEELTRTGMVQGELAWNRLQVNFLKQHRYFTRTNIALRESAKMLHLQSIERLIATV
jgi:uncharacterized protein